MFIHSLFPNYPSGHSSACSSELDTPSTSSIQDFLSPISLSLSFAAFQMMLHLWAWLPLGRQELLESRGCVATKVTSAVTLHSAGSW